jgi:hypothetical protein
LIPLAGRPSPLLRGTKIVGVQFVHPPHEGGYGEAEGILPGAELRGILSIKKVLTRIIFFIDY